jgi:hypothetical protein
MVQAAAASCLDCERFIHFLVVDAKGWKKSRIEKIFELFLHKIIQKIKGIIFS